MSRTVADAFNQYHKDCVDLKAPKESPALTGIPTAPTAGNDTDSTQIATTEFAQNLIRRLVGAAPETLNTLVELATAINNDPKFAQTIVQALDSKLSKTDAANTYLGKNATAVAATKATQDGNGNNIVNTYATKAVASTSANGLMSAADKTKLNGMALTLTGDVTGSGTFAANGALSLATALGVGSFMLKDIEGVNYNSRLASVLTPGCYLSVPAGWTDCPAGVGAVFFFIVIGNLATRTLQILQNMGGGEVFYRTVYSATNAASWYKLSGTVVS